MLATIAAVLAVFFIADLIYTVRHYWVHHDARAYVREHKWHHGRYRGKQTGAVLDWSEFAVYTRSGVAMALLGGFLTWLSGEPGFLIGAVLKWIHNYVFHLYQHAWWGREPDEWRRAPPRAGWGLASARYHAYHHRAARRRPFTYAESWAGFDRILERLHPLIVRFTPDARRSRYRLQAPHSGAQSSRALREE